MLTAVSSTPQYGGCLLKSNRSKCDRIVSCPFHQRQANLILTLVLMCGMWGVDLLQALLIHKHECEASCQLTSVFWRLLWWYSINAITKRLFRITIFVIIISNDHDLLIRMDNDFVLFLVGVGVLVLYLIFSAMTEMGTKLPWKK